jgi:hypothetical protein
MSVGLFVVESSSWRAAVEAEGADRVDALPCAWRALEEQAGLFRLKEMT